MLLTDLILPALYLVAGYFLRSRGPLLPGPATPGTPGLGDGTLLNLLSGLLEKRRQRDQVAELREVLKDHS